MNLGAGRYPHLVATLAGYLKTNIPLVEYDGYRLLPCITNDDIGIYLFIPKLAKFFNLSLDQSINIFFYGIILGSLILGVLGFFFYYRSLEKRIVSLIGLIGIFHLMYTIGDVYCIGPASTTALLPLFLYFSNREKMFNCFQFFLFFAGIIIGFSNYLRAYCGVPIFLFMSIILLFYIKKTIRQKLLLFFILNVGMLSAVFYVNSLYKQYENYAQIHMPDHKYIRKNHVFLHTLYCSFGFLNTMNPDGIEFSDKYAHDKAASINPQVTCQFDEGYDDIIKNELVKLFKYHRYFVLLTLFAKLGVLFFFLLKYANFGLLSALIYPKGWVMESAFFAMLGFSSLYVIAAIPLGIYTVNFMAASILYGVVSVNYGFEKIKSRIFYFMNNLYKWDFNKKGT